MGNVPRTVQSPIYVFDHSNVVELLCAQPEPSDCFIVDKVGRCSTVDQRVFFHLAFESIQIECHRCLDSIEVQGSVVVQEQQRYDVEPDPESEGCYESQGYDYVSELDHDVGREVVDFEGHKRGGTGPTLVRC